MFKGLRTKIESEQKGQSPTRSNKAPISVTQENNHPNIKGLESTIDTASNNPASGPGRVLSKPNVSVTNSSDIIQSLEDEEPLRTLELVTEPAIQQEQSPADEGSLQTLAGLQSQVARLNDQLKNVIKERDECNDQNAQLYQLIEKLRRNLETEKETNFSLQNRLNQVESALKDREDSDSQRGINKTSKNISIRPLETNDASKVETESYEKLLAKVNELQGQLSDKTRQLKIKQQNMNDIKKALQREIMDHGKTQEEFCKLQNQLKQLHGRNDTNGNEILQNGSVPSDIDAATRTNLNLYSDKNQGAKDACDETAGGPQLELMSNLSSAASVDDFDSNDLQHNDKEVNHEYLRNVLFRYMTSTDTETAQHLVKAISVLMNFTPEQSKAIKSAMNSRSSWLRLKK